MRLDTLQGKKVLITGAASGIGRATAVLAAREGAQLVLTDIDAANLESAAKEIRAAGGTVLAARAFDISDHDAVKAFAAEVHAAHGSVDVVMNIAGIAIWGTVQTLEHKHWKRCIDINLMGPINVIESFVPAMIEARRGGWLVNVSSAAGLFGLPWHAAYSASKFGLRGVSEVLRFDLRRHRIGVTLMCPGGVNTGLVKTVQIQGIDGADPQLAKLRDHFAKRAKTPEQAARSIIKAVKAGRYLVTTSADIAIGYWFQRKFALPYEWIMRLMNDQMWKVSRAAAKRSAAAVAEGGTAPEAANAAAAAPGLATGTPKPSTAGRKPKATTEVR